MEYEHLLFLGDTSRRGNLGVDLYALSDSLYHRDPQAFDAYGFEKGDVKLSTDSLRNVQVEVNIRDTGRTIVPADRFTS